MNSHVARQILAPTLSSRPWATASYPESAATSPGELSALSEHVDRCNGMRGRLFAVQCAADAVRSFVAPRFITTLVAIACVIGIVAIAI